MANYTVDKLFDLLDARRHLPDYGLELRASPFFELFLPDVLLGRFGAIRLPIIPEFPLKKDNDQSNKVDFFALSKDKPSAFLIELKTDMNYLNVKQHKYLRDASKAGLVSIVEGIISVSKKSQSKGKITSKKYIHLLKRLEELELLKVPSEVYDFGFRERRQGLSHFMEKIEPQELESGLCLKVVYIVPDCSKARQGRHSIPKNAHCICFEEVARVVEKRGLIGKRFAESLRCWAKVEAGSTPPGDKCACGVVHPVQ